jgi:hypothetical protein
MSIQPNILFLKGCFLNEFLGLEDRLEQKLIDEQITQQEGSHYQTLPAKFTTIEKWPKNTNLKCWECDLTHTNIPVFIPKDVYIDSLSVQTFTVDGHFCSFNCAAKYLDEKYYNCTFWDDRTRFLLLLHKIFTGISTKKIAHSPDKTEMKAYTGNPDGLTEKEFREKMIHYNKYNSFSEYKKEHLDMEE